MTASATITEMPAGRKARTRRPRAGTPAKPASPGEIAKAGTPVPPAGEPAEVAKAEATNRADQIRLGIDNVAALILLARNQEDWRVLGYPDFPSYMRGEYADKINTLRLNITERDAIARALVEDGATVRAAAETLGVSKSTVATATKDVVVQDADVQPQDIPTADALGSGAATPAHRAARPPTGEKPAKAKTGPKRGSIIKRKIAPPDLDKMAQRCASMTAELSTLADRGWPDADRPDVVRLLIAVQDAAGQLAASIIAKPAKASGPGRA